MYKLSTASTYKQVSRIPLKVKEAKSTFNKPFEPARASQPINGIQGSLF